MKWLGVCVMSTVMGMFIMAIVAVLVPTLTGNMLLLTGLLGGALVFTTMARLASIAGTIEVRRGL